MRRPVVSDGRTGKARAPWTRRRKRRLRSGRDGSRSALRGRLRAAPAACDRAAAEALGLGIGQVELANALARVREGDAHRRALTLRNLVAGLVADADRLACQCRPPFARELRPA